MSRIEDRYQSLIHQLVQRVLKLEAWQRDIIGNAPLFDIANEHTPAILTTDQNDYDPGYYDVLRVNATSNISITGVTRGKKGRFLEFYNVSGYKITFPNESVSSAPVNRIINSSGENIILFPTGRVRLYYDSTLTRWVIPDPPSWTGSRGISATAYKASLTQTIPHNTVTQLLFDTVDTGNDEYGIYNTTNSEVTIPAGMGGVWIGQVQGYWFPSTDGDLLQIGISVNGAAISGRGFGMGSVALESQHHATPFSVILSDGDKVRILAFQKTGVDLAYQKGSLYFYLSR